MGRNGITYTQVADICEALKNAGDQISVRAVQSRTGGSMTTVLKHYRRWKDGQGDAHPCQTAISQRLHRALLAELQQATSGTREACKAEFQQEISTLQGRLADSEKRIAALESSLQEGELRRQTQEELIVQLRRELEEAHKLLLSTESRLADSRQKKPGPGKEPQDRPKRKKAARNRKKPEKDQEPNLFDL